ncbi:MAG: VWA domain-containing protein [Clostridiales bacterium]|jgi:uncharacterized protein YegL|nr:VWA domain-containing protein [Clostridiales bacterium]
MADRFAVNDRPIELPNEAHVCLTLVIDVSGSMSSVIGEVNNGVNRMIDELKQDGRLSSVLDMSIITFCDKGAHKVIQPFQSIKSTLPVKLTTGATTYAVDALELARANTSHQKARYQSGCMKPWIVFITDGCIHDDLTDIGRKFKKDELEGKYHVLCFGVGAAYAPKQLALLSSSCFQIINYNFADFFSWIGKSQAVISQAAIGANTNLPATGAICQLSITA